MTRLRPEWIRMGAKMNKKELSVRQMAFIITDAEESAAVAVKTVCKKHGVTVEEYNSWKTTNPLLADPDIRMMLELKAQSKAVCQMNDSINSQMDVLRQKTVKNPEFMKQRAVFSALTEDLGLNTE